MPISDDWDFDYANKVLSHIDGTLAYDTGAGRAPVAGEYIKGDTSNAVAKILSVTGTTVSGTMTLTLVDGIFEDNEGFEVLDELPFDTVANGGFVVGDTLTGATSSDSIVVRAIEYNSDGLGGGTIYGDTLTGSSPYFQIGESLDVTGGSSAVAEPTAAATENVGDLTTTIVNGTLSEPGTASTNTSVIIHYDAGSQLIPEQAIVEDATTGASGLVEQQYGPADGSVGSLRIVDYASGSAFTDNNTLRIDQVIAYNNQVAGEVFSVGDVVVGGTSSATGRVLADTGTQLILADETGTWSNTEDLNVGGTKIAEANGTNTTLNASTIHLPEGIRTEQRPNSVGGGSEQGGIYDPVTTPSLNIVRKLNSLYTLSQDTFDELLQLDDDEALDAQVKGGAYQLVFDWNISENTSVSSVRFLRQGGLQDTNGANVWANPQTVGVQNKITDTAYLIDSVQPYRQPQLYIEQDVAKVSPWWLEGQIDVLLKVRSRNDPQYIAPATPGLGQLISGGDPQVAGSYTVFNREYHVSTYDTTQAAGAAGGVNTVALGTADDTTNNPNGTHTMNYTGGSAVALIVGEEFTAGTIAGNDLKVGLVVSDTGGTAATGTLEYVLKSGTNFVNTDSCTAVVSGKTFTSPTPTNVVAGYGDDIAFSVAEIAATPSGGVGITGTFYPGEPVTQAVTGATGKVVYADTGTDTLYLEKVNATAFSGDNDITGDNSSATWDAGTGATYPSDVDFNADLNNGEGAQPYTGSVSGDLTGASADTVANIYQYSKYLTRQEEETYRFQGPGTSDEGNIGNLYRRLLDAFAEIKPGAPVATFTGTLALAQGWFLDSGYIDANDIRSFSVIDNNGVTRNPPNLQSLTITNVANGWRVAAYRSTGAGQTAILRTEFDVGPVGTHNQAADSTIEVGANTRTVSPLPADVPDTGVLRVLDPNDTGNYLRFPYSSVNRTTNVFTLTSGTIGDVTGSADLTLDDNVHVCLIEQEATGGSVSNTIQFVSNIEIVYKARLKGYKPFRSTGQFGTGGASLGVVQTEDTIVDLP